MALARKSKNADKTTGAGRDPFDAIPLVADGVESKTDLKGRLQLRKEIKPKPGLSERLARRLGFRRDIRINLDENGSLFFQSIDGRRSLKDIERSLRAKWGLSEEKSKNAVVLFTKMLMVRHLMYLQIDRRGDNAGAD
jgi:hypothetical protein